MAGSRCAQGSSAWQALRQPATLRMTATKGAIQHRPGHPPSLTPTHPPDDAKQAVKGALEHRNLLQVWAAQRQAREQQQRLVAQHLLLSQQVHEAGDAQGGAQDGLQGQRRWVFLTGGA